MTDKELNALLVANIEEAYRARSWHGTNLKGSLRGLSVRELSWRPAPTRHNIWEIALHCTYWKYIVRRRLLGERRGSFPMHGSNWFRRPEESTAAAWKRDLQLLEATHRSLVSAVAGAPRALIDRTPAGRKVSNRSMIAGIAMHDVYHAGQIQILKRLMKP